MTNTITTRDLQGMFERLTRAMSSADLPTTHLHLEQGSKTYGRAYRLYLRDPQTGGLHNVPNIDSFLGMTRREAYHSLHMLAQGVEMVRATRGVTVDPEQIIEALAPWGPPAVQAALRAVES